MYFILHLDVSCMCCKHCFHSGLTGKTNTLRGDPKKDGKSINKLFHCFHGLYLSQLLFSSWKCVNNVTSWKILPEKAFGVVSLAGCFREFMKSSLSPLQTENMFFIWPRIMRHSKIDSLSRNGKKKRHERGINSSISDHKNNSEYSIGDYIFVSNCGWGGHVF